MGDTISQGEEIVHQKLLLDQQISLSWDITETNDLLTYSHYLTDIEKWKVYLKSKEFNLFNYTGECLVEGVVDEFYNAYPVLEVKMIKKHHAPKTLNDTTSIVWSGKVLSGTVNTGTVEKEIKNYNFPMMGVWFDAKFSEKYTLQSQNDNEIVFIGSWINSWNTVKISSFLCGKQASNDCDNFMKIFKEDASDTIANSSAIQLYKMSEIESWFFTNGAMTGNKWRGYYIWNADTPTVQDVANHLFVINDRYIKDLLWEHLDEYCADENVILHTYDSYTLIQEDWHQFLDISYNAKDTWKVMCRLELQWSEVLTKKFTYTDYVEEEAEEKDKNKEKEKIDEKEDDKENDKNTSIEEEKEQNEENRDTTEDEANNDNDVKDFDINVEQFVLKPEKSLTFSSARGHKIVFPSPNIAYQEITTKQDLGQQWVNCFANVKVIKYADNAKILENPTVEVYECVIKDTFDDTAKHLIHKVLEKDGKTRNFVIKINDPSWYEFAKNIDIE